MSTCRIFPAGSVLNKNKRNQVRKLAKSPPLTNSCRKQLQNILALMSLAVTLAGLLLTERNVETHQNTGTHTALIAHIVLACQGRLAEDESLPDPVAMTNKSLRLAGSI